MRQKTSQDNPGAELPKVSTLQFTLEIQQTPEIFTTQSGLLHASTMPGGIPPQTVNSGTRLPAKYAAARVAGGDPHSIAKNGHCALLLDGAFESTHAANCGSVVTARFKPW